MKPDEFLARWAPLPHGPANHHFTGLQTPENAGSVLHHEGVILTTLAYNLGGPVLEIGAEKGVSTRYIHEGLEWVGIGGGDRPHVYSVDIRHQWEHDPGWPLRVKVDADSAYYLPPEPVKWAFIDGNHHHPAVVIDIAQTVKAGARYLLFHDTGENNPWPGPRKAVIELPADEWQISLIETQCGMAFAERNT